MPRERKKPLRPSFDLNVSQAPLSEQTIAVRSDLILPILHISLITLENRKANQTSYCYTFLPCCQLIILIQINNREMNVVLIFAGDRLRAVCAMFLNHFSCFDSPPGGGGQCKSPQNDSEWRWQMLCLMPFDNLLEKTAALLCYWVCVCARLSLCPWAFIKSF